MFKPRPPKNDSEAWLFTCINLLATPGLGSLLARRFKSGTGQLLLAATGFLCIFWWFIQKMRLLYGQISGTDLPMDAGNTAGWIGLMTFVTAWIWALVTSVQILQSVKRQSPMDIPPKIV